MVPTTESDPECFWKGASGGVSDTSNTFPQRDNQQPCLCLHRPREYTQKEGQKIDSESYSDDRF